MSDGPPDPNLDNVSDGRPWWWDGDERDDNEHERLVDEQDRIERAKSENER